MSFTGHLQASSQPTLVVHHGKRVAPPGVLPPQHGVDIRHDSASCVGRAADSCCDVDEREVVELGQELWERLGEEPHADAFWDVIAPLVHALAAREPEEAGYGPGFSAATACEQPMHEVGLRHGRGGPT